MAQVAVFLLASYGATNVITASKLLAGVRRAVAERSELAGHWVRCPMCVGVPVGVAWSLLGLETGAAVPGALAAFAAGAVSSGWCWIVRVLMHRLGEDRL